MIYTLIFVTATGIQSMGNYNNLAECQNAANEFKSQEVRVGCVKQESPEQSMSRASSLMKSFFETVAVQK